MTPAEVASDYRRRGRFDLALASARADPTFAGRTEEARALTRLGRPEEALGVLLLSPPPLAGDRAPPPPPPLAGEVAPEAPEGEFDHVLALAEAHLALGHGAEVEALAATLSTLAGDLEPRAAHSALAQMVLANALLLRGEAPRALALAARAAAVLSTYGADDHAQALAALATAHHQAGQWSGAVAAWREAFHALDGLPDHPDRGALLDGLGNTLRKQGDTKAALRAHREAQAFHGALDPFHPARAANHHALAQTLHRTGDFGGARREMADALCISLRRPGADHVDTWVTRFELGRFDVDCGEVERGFRAMEEAHRHLHTRLGAEHPTVVAMARWL